MTQPRRIMPLPLGGEHGLPYSRGLMARALMAVGVAPDRAYSLARRVGDDLASRTSDVVELDRLESLAIETLGEVEGREALRQLRRYQELRELDLPIIILVGGATGTGKSTVATEIAYRLGITRVTSTDFIRQTMRAFFSHEFMPSIHYSSFEAAIAQPDADDPLLARFLDQSRQVLVGVRASMERALQEGWSMVLEGVHLVPGLLPRNSSARSSPPACSRSPTRRRTPSISSRARPAPTGRWRSTSTASARSGGSSATSSSAPSARESP